MPIYRFYCAGCSEEQEVILPTRERDNTRIHTCGSQMVRLPTLPAPAQFPATTTDKVLNTLNKQEGCDFPGGDKHRPRYEKAMARGLYPEKPTIGRGFG